jgi:hypothetical protein
MESQALEAGGRGGREPDSLAPIGVVKLCAVGGDEHGLVSVGAGESPAGEMVRDHGHEPVGHGEGAPASSGFSHGAAADLPHPIVGEIGHVDALMTVNGDAGAVKLRGGGKSAVAGKPRRSVACDGRDDS